MQLGCKTTSHNTTLSKNVLGNYDKKKESQKLCYLIL